MTRPRADVSVIICTYTEERWDDLTACVESVRRQTVAPRETVLVVDHNPALLARIRAELAGPDTIVIENRETRGLSGARNSGIRASSGALVAFLDDDAAAAPDWLDLLVRACDDRRILGAGGRVEPDWLTGRPAWFPEEFLWVIGCTHRGIPTEPGEVRSPFGGSMCLRRELFDAVGLFRSELGRVGTVPLAGEETELALRARKRWPDRTFFYEPRSRIFHRVPAARTRWSYFRARCFGEGLSKALTARFVGGRDGLADAREYTYRTLPLGVLRGLADATLGLDPAGVQRAAAIVAGFACTAAGYAVGTVAPSRALSTRARVAPARRRPRVVPPPPPTRLPAPAAAPLAARVAAKEAVS
jgi:glucosyl-dolichyl phosphate glucuronosyltransferase